MVKLQDKLGADIKNAMLAKDEIKRDILRVLKGELERTSKESDNATIAKSAKKLIESIKESNSDKGEIAILEEYILPQMTDAELVSEVTKLKTVNQYGPSDMGKVMSYFKANYNGQYDGKSLSDITRQVLA